MRAGRSGDVARELRSDGRVRGGRRATPGARGTWLQREALWPLGARDELVHADDMQAGARRRVRSWVGGRRCSSRLRRVCGSAGVGQRCPDSAPPCVLAIACAPEAECDAPEGSVEVSSPGRLPMLGNGAPSGCGCGCVLRGAFWVRRRRRSTSGVRLRGPHRRSLFSGAAPGVVCRSREYGAAG